MENFKNITSQIPLRVTTLPKFLYPSCLKHTTSIHKKLESLYTLRTHLNYENPSLNTNIIQETLVLVINFTAHEISSSEYFKTRPRNARILVCTSHSSIAEHGYNKENQIFVRNRGILLVPLLLNAKH